MVADFDTKERVKQATDLVQLMGSYLQLRRQGPVFVAHCPWHDDRKPSLQINPTRQTWACWVCNIRGDVFDFMMRREGVEFREALQMLADRAGITLRTVERTIQKGSPEDKQTLFKAMSWAAKQFHQCLLDSASADLAREYLQKRNINSASVERWQLGFAPLEWTWLLDRSRGTEFSPAVLEACGLMTRRGTTYESWSERFRGRLIFPIVDSLGRHIAFGGRLVPGVFKPEDEPPGKYVNSPETRLFSKSDHLYGLNFAADAAAKSRHLIVVEGYTDVIAADQAGMREVVAALGTAVGQRHIRVMKRYADRVTMVLDGDVAGQKRTSEILDLFVAENIDLRILTLPEGLDPFDFFQTQGAEPFREQVARAPDALEHRILCETKGLDLIQQTHEAQRALDRILQTLAQVPQSISQTQASVRIRQDQLLMRLARQFQIDRKQLQQRLQELQTKVPSYGNAEEVSPQQSDAVLLAKLQTRESELLQLVLIDSTLMDLVIERISLDQFEPGPLRRIFEIMSDAFHQAQDFSFEGLMLLLEDPELKNLLVLLDDQSREKQLKTGWDSQWQLQQVIKHFDESHLDRSNHQVINRLEQKHYDDLQEVEALQRLFDQMKERKGI